MNFDRAINFINKNSNFIITAHETPDGDALGSEYAMLKALQKLGKQALVFNADPTPDNFQFIDQTGEINRLTNPAGQLPADLKDYALLILDVNDTGNIGCIATDVLPAVKEFFIIDHHEQETSRSGENHIEQSASSTAEILYQLFEILKVPLDLNMANALFVAIVYDTGSFIYPKTSALTFKIAHELVKFGVKPHMIYRKVYENRSISFLRLQSKVLATLELKCDNHIAVQTMTRELLQNSGASYDEGQQLINIPLASNDVKVSIFFKENLEGLLRCSLRSKDHIDVAEIAHLYQGGGHRTAAGFKCRQPIEQIKQNVLSILRSKYFSSEA